MKNLKTQRGITLIALIITVILMLILVGVTVTVALNGGLFSTAQQAVSKTQIELEKEQLFEAAIGAIGNDGKIVTTKLKLPDGFTESEGVYTSIKSGNKYAISENGSVTKVYEEYSIGEEITVGGENFYVIADSGKTEETVTLLAKYPLNSAGKAQASDGSAPAVQFSSEPYWSNGTGTYLDLNKYPIPNGVTSVITTANIYGQEKGGDGRLLLLSEERELESDPQLFDILKFAYSPHYSGRIWWLGTVLNPTTFPPLVVSSMGYDQFDETIPGLIRPVIEISKDNI